MRRVLRVLLPLLLAWGALHVVNLFRFDQARFDEGVRAIATRMAKVRDRARSEYQEYVFATLPSNPLNGTSWRLDLRLDEAKALEEPSPATGDEITAIASFEFEDGSSPFEAVGLEANVRNGALVATTAQGGYLRAEGLAIPRDDVGQIVIRMRADRGSFFRLAWRGEGPAPEQRRIWRHRLELRLQEPGKFHTYVIDARNVLKRGLAEGERLTRLYLLPSDAPGARVEIDYIRFLGKTARYAGAVRGRLDETVGGIVRPVLYLWPDQRLAFDLELPRRNPRFDFGAAVLRRERPIRFLVRLTDAAGDTFSLHDRLVSDTGSWGDVRIDLGRWAGQRVRLELAVQGSADNVALWADPTVWGDPVEPLRVIWILEDAERARSLSLYGYERRTTPFKERLAQRAVVFTRAFSQANKTRPSVASFMTGLYPSATGLWHFADVLSERHLTLAEILRAQGFATAAFIQNGNAGPYAGLHQGFGKLFDETRVGGPPEKVLLGEDVWSWIDANRDRNFFLYLHALDPHAPYNPPPDYRDSTMDRGTAVARNPVLDPGWVEQPTLEGRRARYEAEIRHNDAVLERFFARLEEEGLLDNTLVILTADHGEFLGERGLLGNRLWDHHPPSYFAVSHVPLVLVPPGRFPRGQRIDVPVQLVDLAPTILDLARVPRDDLLLHGESLLPLLENPQAKGWRERVVMVEEPTAMEKSDPCVCGSLIDRDWQLLGSPWVFKRSWLYFPHLTGWLLTHAYRVDAQARPRLDLLTLPDLYLRWYHRSRLARLRDLGIDTWRRITGGVEGGGVVDPETLERLRGLGYVN